MFACMFLQLHGDKGVDYCLSDFGFFLMPLAERCTHWRVQLSWAWPVWRSVPFHNKIYETHRDECHLRHCRYLRFRLSEAGGHSLHPSISAVIYTQMEVYIRMGDWWGENYQWWCQAWIGEKRVFVIITLAALQGRSSCEEALPECRHPSSMKPVIIHKCSDGNDWG